METLILVVHLLKKIFRNYSAMHELETLHGVELGQSIIQ